MIRLLGKIPKDVAIAVSGGPDSMAALDFCVRGGRNILVLYFNHGTEHGAEAEEFVTEYCDNNDLKLKVGRANRERRPNESPEEYWRNMRYDFLFDATDLPIITAHTLDDQVEQWIFSSLHGNPSLIPYQRGDWHPRGDGSLSGAEIIRPLLLVKKNTLLNWCRNKGVPYLIDPSNNEHKYIRSFIRNQIVPSALVVNPGIHKVVAKKVLKEYEDDA